MSPALCTPFALVLWLAQAPMRVAVIDVSKSDAIYEDVSRGIAEVVVAQLNKEGLSAIRVDESTLPAGGCREGPCLGAVAKAHQAQVLVALDAEEVTGTTSRVALAALGADDGRPLAVARCVFVAEAPPPRIVRRFAQKILAATSATGPPSRPIPPAPAASP